MSSEKRRVPDSGRDPFVTAHARREAARKQAEEEKRGDNLRRRWASRPSTPSGSQRRRQNTFLMYIFFFLALVVYIGANIASPKLEVQLNGASGDVFVDGQRRGKTGEVIRNVPPGMHEVSVLPDSIRLIAQPDVKQVRVEWGLAPAVVTFDLIVATGPEELEGGDSDNGD